MKTYTCLFDDISFNAKNYIAWLESTERVVFQPPSGGAWYPRLLELTNGNWLCAYDTNQGAANTRVWISRSLDQGESWSYLSQASFGTGDAANGQLTQLANGDLLCAYRLVNEPTKTLKVSRSTNNGQSWSDLSTIISNTEGVWEPHIIQKDDGQLLVFYAQEAGVPGSDQIVEMQRSDDNGATWHSTQTVSQTTGSRDGMPVPVILNNGDIFVVLEGHDVNRNYQFVTWSVRSSDGGNNWGPRQLVYAPSNISYNAAAPFSVQMPTGEIIVSYQTNEVPAGYESQMGVLVSRDNGSTWFTQPTPFPCDDGYSYHLSALFVEDADTIVAATTAFWGGPDQIKIIKGTILDSIIYVDTNAGGTNNGTSWEDAYNELQDALNAAWVGDEIRVADGNYLPDQGTGQTPGDRTTTFQLKNGVTLKGGYAGDGAPGPNERNVDLYETILSGDIGTVDDSSDNSYHVVTGSGTDSTAVLDGFTITAGNADSSYPNDRGGGMYNNVGSPTVTTCTFIGNTADRGGGMYNASGSPTVTTCTFIGNTANFGGGMYNSNSSPTICNCIIRGNTVTQEGGGIDCTTSEAVIINCLIEDNISGYYAGGINCSESSDLTIIGCTIRNNSAENDGGGIQFTVSSGQVINCSISNNVGLEGGGIWVRGTVHISNCTIVNNTATRSGGYGGALALDYDSATVTNCILWDNIPNEVYTWEHTPSVSYTDIKGGWSGAGVNNIDIDPNFADPNGLDGIIGTVDDNLRLLPGSPCIETGDNTVVTEPNDLDGLGRIVDGDCDETATVDMGAHEFDWLYVGDFAGGCNVDLADFAVLSQSWQQDDPAIDIVPYLDSDGIIDMSEMLILCEYWLAGK